MPFSNNFPYTDLHDINLNKFLKAIKNLLGGHGGEFLKKQSNIPFDYAWEPVEVSAPVQSVNGQTGNVILDAEDVGALPDTYTAPVQSVNGQTGEVVLDAEDVGSLPDTTKYAESNSVAGPAKKTETIPYGECDSTSTSTAFTATVPGITELKNGTVMLLKNGVVTSASGFTLNINGLGAKPSYSNMATGNDVTPTAPTRDTTIFNINYTMLFIYDETLVSGGCWISYRGYDANTNTIGYQVRTNSLSLPMKSVVYRYRLLFTSADGNGFVPANNSTSTNATTARNITQEKIDPFGSIVYYGATSSVSAGNRPSATVLWQQYNFTIGYSFVVALTAWKPVYLKCAPQTDGSAIIDSTTPFVQNLPSSNDGKIYIFMGVAYSTTSMELTINHPVYYHDGTSIKLWTGGESSSGAVNSVNGQTGDVVLDASDVNAISDVYAPTVEELSFIEQYTNPLSIYLYKENTYINQSGVETALQGYNLYKIPVRTGNIVQVKQTSGNYNFWYQLNANYVIRLLLNNERYAVINANQNSDAIFQTAEKIITTYVKDTYTHLMVCCYASYENDVEVLLNTPQNMTPLRINETNSIKSKAYFNNGTTVVQLSGDYCTYAFPIKKGEQVYVSKLPGTQTYYGVFSTHEISYTRITSPLFTATEDGFVQIFNYEKDPSIILRIPLNDIHVNYLWCANGNNQFIGLNGVAFGTSLTNRSLSTYGYLQYLPGISGINFDNRGIGSSVILGNLLTAIKNYSGYSNKRICIIEGFVNDWYQGNILGTYSDSTETTVCGCIRSAINYIYSQNPDITIFLVLDHYGKNVNNVDCSSTAVNGNNLTQYQYYEEIAKVANSLGVPVIKLYAKSQISENTPQYLTDNIHPTMTGAKQTAYSIWAEMKKYYPNII